MGVTQDQEEELLMHVAAGTDLFTAFAALPRESDPPDKPQPSTPAKSAGELIWALLAFFLSIAALWLMAQ